ncbi:prepilin-type N-terminal cleavage/methylation domain-containing protein [Candidatus Poribacteria bacterium]|nr:prepilin-type N-terminal cleavage/methylation domain-containing protein [Candidatus Poribacteria bacterium]
MNRSRAFTLIELLIVVAIIAILAAIAVPNFLEAQVRSKVSRAKSDLRTVATGLEAYAVDYNNYPYTETIGSTPWLPPGGHPLRNSTERPGGLTSPIAYLTTLPNDSFVHPIGNGISVTAPVYYERAGFGYVNGVRTAMQVAVPSDALGQNQKLDGIGGDVFTTDPLQLPTRWVLYSIGPDLQPQLHDENDAPISYSRFRLDNRYDPTNGTISTGNILQFPGGMSFP